MIKKQLTTSLSMLIMFTVLGGLIYPLVMTGLAQVTFPLQANGSLITKDGYAVGSELIGQNFSSPGYFHGRPSVAGPKDGYDAASSAGSNLGPTSKTSLDIIAKRAQQVRDENYLPPDAGVPADLVTASASGLDPHISPEAAALQVDRVAQARNLSPQKVITLVSESIEGRELGIFGEPRVNVLELNLKLDQLNN